MANGGGGFFAAVQKPLAHTYRLALARGVVFGHGGQFGHSKLHRLVYNYILARISCFSRRE